MRIREIKAKIKKWHDFYGQDISTTDEIDAIKTREQAIEVLESHRKFLEMQNTDALKDIDRFERELGIY